MSSFCLWKCCAAGPAPFVFFFFPHDGVFYPFPFYFLTASMSLSPEWLLIRNTANIRWKTALRGCEDGDQERDGESREDQESSRGSAVSNNVSHVRITIFSKAHIWLVPHENRGVQGKHPRLDGLSSVRMRGRETRGHFCSRASNTTPHSVGGFYSPVHIEIILKEHEIFCRRSLLPHDKPYRLWRALKSPPCSPTAWWFSCCNNHQLWRQSKQEVLKDMSSALHFPLVVSRGKSIYCPFIAVVKFAVQIYEFYYILLLSFFFN